MSAHLTTRSSYSSYFHVLHHSLCILMETSFSAEIPQCLRDPEYWRCLHVINANATPATHKDHEGIGTCWRILNSGAEVISKKLSWHSSWNYFALIWSHVDLMVLPWCPLLAYGYDFDTWVLVPWFYFWKSRQLNVKISFFQMCLVGRWVFSWGGPHLLNRSMNWVWGLFS